MGPGVPMGKCRQSRGHRLVQWVKGMGHKVSQQGRSAGCKGWSGAHLVKIVQRVQ